MDTNQIAGFVIVMQALIIIALLLVVYGQGKQLGGAYPADVKNVLGALAGLAVFFAAHSPTALDNALISTVLLPIFRLLGIEVPLADSPAESSSGGDSTPAAS